MPWHFRGFAFADHTLCNAHGRHNHLGLAAQGSFLAFQGLKLPELVWGARDRRAFYSALVGSCEFFQLLRTGHG